MDIENLVSIKEIARRLGVSLYTVYYWAAAGRIPHYRIGRNLRFSWPEVEEWLRKHRREVA